MVNINKRAGVIITYETDTQSANKAMREAGRVNDAIREGADEGISRTNKLREATERFISNLQSGTKVADEYYSNINRDVGLAGDVASNAAQLAGALDAVGASFAGGALEGLVILGDTLEGLPRLKASIQGIPSVIGNVVSSIGVGGFGLIGVLGGLVGALALVTNATEKARLEAEAYAKAETERAGTIAGTAQLLARNNETEAISELISAQDESARLVRQISILEEERARVLSEEEKRLETLRRGAVGLGSSFILAGNNVEALSLNAQALDTELQTLNDQLSTNQAQIGGIYEAFLEAGFTFEEINALIEENTTAQEDNADAIKEVNNLLLAQADAVRNRYLEEISLLDQTEQGLKARQDQIRAEIEANTRAIATLEASGDTSEQVTAQIEKYRLANEELGKTLEFIGNTALPSATARALAEQAQADTEKTQRDMIDATKQFNSELENLNESAYEELYKIEEQRTKTLLDIAKKYADDTQKALDTLNKELEGARANYQKGELDARENALRQERDATQKHYEALSDISTNAKREEQDALRNLDFKGAFEARRNANRAIEDEQKQFTREQKDRMQSQADERQDRLRAYEQAQRDAQANYQKELDTARKARQTALREAEQGYNQELQLARNSQAQKLSALQAGYMSELTLAQQTASQRLAIQQAIDAQLLASAQRVLSVGFGGSRRAPIASNYRGATPPPSTPPNQRITNQNIERQRALERARSGGGGGVNININNATNPQRTAEQVKTIINNNRGGG